MRLNFFEAVKAAKQEREWAKMHADAADAIENDYGLNETPPEHDPEPEQFE
jgi:hypothetical protein